MNHPQTNPRVCRYVVRIEHIDGRVLYLARSKEVVAISWATFWGTPRQAYTAMAIYGKKLLARSRELRKSVFMEVLDTREQST